MMMSKWNLFFPLMLFLCVSAQDANWGKKVKCYIVDGMTLCPGCNSRGGLICPRVIPEENKCDSTPSTTKAPIDEKDLDEKGITDSSVVDTKATDSSEPTETTFDAKTTFTAETTPEITTDQDENNISPKPTPNLLDMRIHLYRILQDSAKRNPYYDFPKRSKREALPENEPCRWNGDCPCPQICCRNGEDRPKTCKMGIRLPPPWG